MYNYLEFINENGRSYKHLDFKKELDKISSSSPSRSISIDIKENDNPVDVIKHYAPWYDINCKTPIYRGLMSRFSKVLMVDPSKHIRKSKNQENYTTLIIDNSDLWSEYPDRGKSIICTTEFARGMGFGEVYRVIPLEENAKFGLCPTTDIFQSFTYTFDQINKIYSYEERAGGKDIQYLAQFTHLMGKQFKLEKNDDYQTIRRKVNDRSKWFNKSDDLKNYGRKIEPTINTAPMIEEHGNMFNLIEHILNPTDNNFKTFNYNNSIDIPTHMESRYKEEPLTERGKECWTDSRCLLINEKWLTTRKLIK